MCVHVWVVCACRYGYLTWEWEHRLRGFLHPGVFALVYALLDALRMDSPEAIVRCGGAHSRLQLRHLLMVRCRLRDHELCRDWCKSAGTGPSMRLLVLSSVIAWPYGRYSIADLLMPRLAHPLA